MKLLIASDLHGSAQHCAALLEAFQRENADKLLLLGDILYRDFHSDLPGDVIDQLNGMADRIWSVKGNCDSHRDQSVLYFPMMADYALLHIDGQTLYATHGHGYGPHNPPPLGPGEYLLCGHTHIPARQDYGDFIYLNPGSVSLPKRGTRHSYMMLSEGRFSWHDLFTGEDFRPR